jgi:uncharacterized membrane protein
MLKKIIIAFVAVLILIQFIPLDKTNPKVDKTIALDADKKVMGILKRSCYDCHSNETKWSIYSDIAPLSFEVLSHVNVGREALNFSEYKKIPKDIKIKRLKRAIQTVRNSMMPLSSYLMFHDEAKLSDEDKQVLIKYFETELRKISPDEWI